MTNPVPQTEDPTLLRLTVLEGEFDQHKVRLAARAKEIGAKVTSGELDVSALGGLVVELYQELHDTSLSFQQDLTRILREDLEAAPPDDGGALDEDASQLEPADAAQLRRTSTDYIACLNAMLAPNSGYPEDARPALRDKLKDAEESVELINRLELVDDETEDDDDDEDDEDDDEPADADATN